MTVLDSIDKIYLDIKYLKKYKESLRLIYKYVNEEAKRLYVNIQNPEDKLNEVIFSVRHISAEVYSACEIINGLFISIYRNDDRYRGTSLANSFNANFKKIYKAHIKNNKLNGVLEDKILDYLYYKSSDWYIMLHDIRTQETHYEIGKVEIKNDTLWYSNNNRNGVSKELYTNPSDVIEVEIMFFEDIVNKFIKTQDFIESIFQKCID